MEKTKEGHHRQVLKHDITHETCNMHPRHEVLRTSSVVLFAETAQPQSHQEKTADSSKSRDI